MNSMCIFYIDEARRGVHLRAGEQSPFFVAGGLITGSEGCIRTEYFYESYLSHYFNGHIPANFHLHAPHLLSADGAGFFLHHPVEKRYELAAKLIRLVEMRKHHFYYIAIDTAQLNAYDSSVIEDFLYFDAKAPFMVAYDHLITAFELYVKENAVTANAIVMVNEKTNPVQQVEVVTQYRRHTGPPGRRVKHIAEFASPVNPAKNVMMQLSGLLLTVTNIYVESENELNNLSANNPGDILRDLYMRIYERLIFKSPPGEAGHRSVLYNAFIKQVCGGPNALSGAD